MSFIGSYVWKLRQALGSQRLLVPGIGAFIFNPQGQIWLGKRTDSGEWSYFGGAMELGDSVMDTVIKEVQEETGLTTTPANWTYIGMHTTPTETNMTYPNGDLVQIVNHFFSMVHTGQLGLENDDEHSEFATFNLEDLPTNLKADNRPALALYAEFLATGKVQVN